MEVHIAELLRTEDTRAEPHGLENLVTHRIKKFWLSRKCPHVRSSVLPYVRTSVRKVPYLEK